MVISVLRKAATDARRELEPELERVRASRTAFDASPLGRPTLRQALREFRLLKAELESDPTP